MFRIVPELHTVPPALAQNHPRSPIICEPLEEGIKLAVGQWVGVRAVVLKLVG